MLGSLYRRFFFKAKTTANKNALTRRLQLQYRVCHCYGSLSCAPNPSIVRQKHRAHASCNFSSPTFFRLFCVTLGKLIDTLTELFCACFKLHFLWEVLSRSAWVVIPNSGGIHSLHAAGYTTYYISCLVSETLANLFQSLPRWICVRLFQVHITLWPQAGFVFVGHEFNSTTLCKLYDCLCGQVETVV